MVEEIAQLVDDVREEQRNLQDTELRLLQAQINPHFLYNTLDAIMWLTEAGEKEEAVSMLSSLSEFFRTTLSSGRDYVTLEEEDNHIRSYLNIQRFRYQDIMDYRIAFDEDILPFYIQKMTLQPIVENALYHGIKNKRGMGLIEVGGHRAGGDIILTVRDNGIGMTKEQLTHLRNVLEGREAAEQEWNGFGMVNVQKRIRLGFGSAYGLTVDSVYGEGCTVTVRIPAVESDAVRQMGQRTERPIISGSLLQEGGEEAHKA
jgi:two-component system sensor histidine kinase YesM